MIHHDGDLLIVSPTPSPDDLLEQLQGVGLAALASSASPLPHGIARVTCAGPDCGFASIVRCPGCGQTFCAAHAGSDSHCPDCGASWQITTA